MSLLHKIAYHQGRRDEIPNQQVARELLQTRSQADIHEIAENLHNSNPNIQSDCLKVLYELGYLDPQLIAEYVDDFIKLLGHRNNRMVWGGMIALSTIANLQADRITPHLADIKKAMASGSTITNDAGVRTLSKIASVSAEYRPQIVPTLLERLAGCRAVDAPRYAEMILPAIDAAARDKFISILDKWIESSSASRLSRLRKIHKLAGDIS